VVFSKGKVGERRSDDDADLGADHLGEADRALNKSSSPQAQEQPAIDPRLIFLERAAARLILFEAGLLELDEAKHGLLASLGPRKRSRKRSAT
jgi:hypothetical protein